MSPPRDPAPGVEPGRRREPGGQALRRLIAHHVDGILVVGTDGIVLFANAAAEGLLRAPGERLVGTEFGHPVAAGAMTEIDTFRTERVAEMGVSEVEWEDRPALLVSLRDITERRQAERARARLAALVEASDDAIVGVGTDGLIESWNRGAARLYGYTAAEAVGRPLSDLFAPEEARERDRRLGHVLRGDGTEQFETRDLHKDGTVLDVSVTDSPIRDRTGAVVGIARTARDITERVHHERQLRFYADHDPLTGVFNRRRLAEELAREIAYADRDPETAAALLVCDLDNFKYINDTLGHQAGDQFIRRIATLIGDRLRETDVIARLGGDEFAVVLPRTTLEQARTVAEDLRCAVREARTTIGDRRVRSTVSIGVAAIVPGATAESWLAAADIAMYEAKHQGRDRVAAADGERGPVPMERHLGRAEQLRDALDHERFVLYQQPIVDPVSGRTVSRELLLRLRDDRGALLLPARFIDTAERFGLITEIDHWVIRRAVEHLAAEPDATSVLNVNLSGISLADRTTLPTIEAALRDAPVDPARLIFEYTETAAMRDLDHAREFTVALGAIGCATALDDFGSGFGSFSYLKHLPVRFLKIDGEFVRHLPGSEDDRVFVRAMTDVAHGLGREVVAEHVSSSEAVAMLRRFGVDLVQGFHVGQPAPLEVAAARTAAPTDA